MKKLLFVLLLAGCATTEVEMPTPNFNDAAGAANKMVTTLGSAVTAECRNTVPDGPCVETSVITTRQKDGLKAQLVEARKNIETAWTLYATGQPVEANNKLATAQGVLRAIRTLLEERGVPQ